MYMDIWDFVEMRDDDETEEYLDEEEEEEEKPLTYEELLKAWSNCNLLKKYTLPTPEQALKDLNRILSSQKFRSWRLVSNNS